MPNTIAYLALIAWPLVAFLLYRRLDTLTATFWTIVGGYMFLPTKTEFDLPFIPPISKEQVAALSAVVCLLFIKRQKIYFLGINRFQTAIFIVLVFIPLINVFFNSQPVFDGRDVIRGLSLYDGIAATINQYLFLLPFVIGASLNIGKKELYKLSLLLIYAGLLYSIFALIEIRLSPQLHTWIYGFFPHSFAQQIRFDGFRPVVFMGHGLLVALFFTVCTCMAFVQYQNSNNKLKFAAILVYFLIILVLCKTFTAVILFCLFIALTLLTRLFGTKMLKGVAFMFLLYPIFSIFNLMPYEFVVDLAEQLNEERAGSLAFRFYHEELLVFHTQERFFIGWGGWSRNRLFDSVTDGYWIIVFSQYGLIYFLALFMLYLSPIFSMGNISKNDKSQYLILAFSTVILITAIDQIPNSSLGHGWLWLLSGLCSSYCWRSKINKKANSSVAPAIQPAYLN